MGDREVVLSADLIHEDDGDRLVTGTAAAIIEEPKCDVNNGGVFFCVFAFALALALREHEWRREIGRLEFIKTYLPRILRGG